MWYKSVYTAIMVAIATSLFLALASASVAWKTGADKCDAYSHHINYTTVPGFFLQDEASTDASTFDYVGICHTTQSARLRANRYPDDGQLRSPQQDLSHRLIPRKQPPEPDSVAAFCSLR